MRTLLAALTLVILFAITAHAGEAVVIATVDKTALPLVSPPAPMVTEHIEYYDVRGISESELRCQMDQNGCRWKDGKRYDAVTTWRVKWDYSHIQTRTCDPASFRVMLEITYRYPQWQRSEEASESLVEKWQAYLRNLTTHEHGHRDMAIEATQDIARSVQELPAPASCEDLEQQVRNLSQKRMAKLDADSRDYDSRTRHGATQGALFP